MKRKEFLQRTAWALAATQLPGILSVEKLWASSERKSPLLQRVIPKTGQSIASIGMGTWISFNVGASERLRTERAAILQAFLQGGGEMVDSSPMYGSSEEVMGACFEKLGRPTGLFSATKLWTSSTSEGREQHQASKRLWKLPKLDLQQVHNLLNWKEHLGTLRALKEAGEIRYIGITTSHGRRHEDVEKIMKTESLDFVQFTYNITHRDVEKRLLKVAEDQGVAVIVNRPYDGGRLMNTYKSKPLPGVAREAGISSWAEFFLKWTTSHPAVTVAIPATTRLAHMNENMLALRGKFFDQKLRAEMVKALTS